MQPLDPQKHVVGILAGAGEYPRLMIEGAKRAGFRVAVAGFRGAVGKDIPPLCDAFRKFRVGAVDGPRDFFLQNGVTHVVMTGQIKPACIYTMWPDATARRLLAQLDRRNAHTIFGAVCDYVTANGMQMLPSTAFMDEVLPGEEHLAGPALSEQQHADALQGMRLAREIARLDIGQSLIVRGADVTCVEAFKGTNECIKNGSGRADSPVTLCKVTKPGHDMRFDVQTGGDYKALAQSVGVTVLDGEYADIEIKGQKVRIGGIFDHSIYIEDYGKRWYDSPVYEYLKDFEKTESLSLLMMHRPNTFIYTDDKWNIDAVFSGHVHGGIWQIPFFRGVYAPEQGFLPEYDKGEYDVCGMKMFLSAGLEGYSIVPRLFNRVEILKITMHNT